MDIYRQLKFFIQKPAFKSAGIYTFSNFLAKSVGFFLLFIYSDPAYLNVDENGLLSLLAGSVSIFIPFLSMGIIHSASVEFFKLSKDEFRNFFTTGFIIPIIVMLFGTAGLFFFRNELHAAYNFPESFILIIPLLAFFTFCNELFVTLVRNNDEPVIYLKVSILRLCVEAGLSLLLVIQFALRWQGRVIGMLTACVTLFFAAYLYFVKKNYLFGGIRTKYLKSELIYAIPIITMQAGIFFLFSSDKFFLSYFSDNNSVGIYSYACAFSAILTIAGTAVLSYIMPKIYLCLSKTTIDFRQIKRYLIYYTVSNLCILLMIIVSTPFLYKYFINHKYYSGLNYLFLIVIGYFFWNMSYFFYSFLLYKKEKKKILLLSVLSIGISVSCNFYFIKNWHSIGAAVSVCISFFLVFLVALSASAKEIKQLMIGEKKVDN